MVMGPYMGEVMARSFAHWTPRYIYDRSRLALYERRHPASPWLTADAIALIDQLLLPTDVGMEFGSGRSTRWFARRVARLTSIEANPDWYETVSKQIAEDGADHVEYLLRKPSVDYAAAADEIEPQSLNFCLIDGDERDQCLARCMPKLAPGSVLIIDNVHLYLPTDPVSSSPASRTHQDGCATSLWQDLWEEISRWRRIWTSNGVWDTAIFFRPS